MAILFDWDGTLYDCVDTSVEVYSKVFEFFRLKPITRVRLRNNFEANWYNFYELNGLHRRFWLEADYLWFEHMRKREGETKLFPGCKEVLEELHSSGKKIGLVSGGNRKRIIRFAKKEGILKYFDTMVCFEDYKEGKPSPLPLLMALKKLGEKAKDSVYIGDLPDDIIAARRAGMKAVAVTHGFCTSSRLKRAKPDYMINGLKNILKVVRPLG